MIATLRGFISYRVETGIDRGFWSFWDERFVSSGRRDIGGQYILQTGDYLKIFDRDRPIVIWEGYILFDEDDSTGQKNVPKVQWMDWFRNCYPAELTLFKGRFID